MMIEGYILKADGDKKEFFAFNDVVITRPAIAKMAKIAVSHHHQVRPKSPHSHTSTQTQLHPYLS
jgi:NAD kinase